MNDNQVHYEVFCRRKSTSSWTLDLATEDRAGALKSAEEMLTQGRAVAVKVTKETLDAETREFKTVTILTKGEAEKKITKAPVENLDPMCVSPAELYTAHARDRIGRLLEGFLARNRATPFELLHRPDLIERLDAAGMDLQHAIQKIAVPEAAARNVRVHEMMRNFQRLAQSAIERVLKDARKGAFPDLKTMSLAEAAERVVFDPERHYRLGGAVAGHLAQAKSWKDKVDLILDLADAAPQSPAARVLAFQVLEQPLAEILGARAGMADLLGGDLDLGGSLAAMTRLAAADTVEALVRIEPTVAKVMPPLEGAAARLANWLEGPYFVHVRGAIVRRVIQELQGPRRLRPADAAGEIDILRALAMSLTAAAGKAISVEEVKDAFIARSQLLVRSDFIEAYLGVTKRRPALAEVQALLWLAENVTGASNRRQANRWVASNVGALRFETELRSSQEPPINKLAALAALQRAILTAMPLEEAQPIAARIGEVGGLVEGDAHVVAGLARPSNAPINRLTLLLRFAMGDAAPLGPAAERAKLEATKLMRLHETRQALAEAPEALERIRTLAHSAGMAA